MRKGRVLLIVCIMLLAVGCQKGDAGKENNGGSAPTESVATSEPSAAPNITSTPVPTEVAVPTAVPTEEETPTPVSTEAVTPTPTAELSPTEELTGVPEDIQEEDKICYSPDHTAWVKYSIDGTITLYYEDKVIDITDKFKEGLCYLYTIGSDGNEVYVSIQYKSEVVTDSNEFENVWKYYWGGYTTDDTKEKYTSVCDPYNPIDDSLEGTFRLDDNNRIRIWRGDLVFSSEYEIFVMEHYDAEDEQTYEIADNYHIWLFYPLCAEGAFATRDGFLHVLKETKVDCFYHLNEDGLVDDIRGIYYP